MHWTWAVLKCLAGEACHRVAARASGARSVGGIFCAAKCITWVLFLADLGGGWKGYISRNFGQHSSQHVGQNALAQRTFDHLQALDV